MTQQEALEQGVKYCKDCRHCEQKPREIALCMHPDAAEVDLVLGLTPPYAHNARLIGQPCGFGGHLHEAIVAEPEPPPVAIGSNEWFKRATAMKL